MILKSQQFKRPLIHKRIDAKYKVNIECDSNSFQGYNVNRIEELEFPFVLEKDEIIVDFGDHYTGYLHIELDNGDKCIADSPTNIAFEFAEMPIELMEEPVKSDCGVSLGWVQKDFKSIVFLPYSGSLERRYAFRYLRIKRVDSIYFPVKVKALYIDSVSAVDIDSALQCNIADPLLKRIDAMCLKTLKECEQDVFEDGPKRDRRLWIGDLRLQALTDYVSFKNVDLIKRCIYLFAENLSKDGIVAQCIFQDSPPYADQWGLMDYSICFALCLYDYLVNTNDSELISELYDIAKKQIKYIAEKFDEEQAKINAYFFIDHQEFDRTIATLGYYVYTLKRMLVLANSVGDNTEWIEDLIEKTEKALKSYYSENAGLFVAPNGEISWHSQIWAALSGVFEKEKGAKLLKKAAASENTVNISTPFMKHYYLEALYSCDMKTEAENEIKDYWGAILDAGFDCCPEVFVPGDDLYSPVINSNVVLNSACHAWSCSPAYWIRKYSQTK